MSPQTQGYIALCLGIILNVVAQFLFKAWADGRSIWFLVMGQLAFNLDALAWAFTLRKGIDFVETGLWWDVGAAVLLMLGNWWLFGWRPALVSLAWLVAASGCVLISKRGGA